MSPLANATFTLALGFCAVVPPFLLGRWVGRQDDCRRCADRIGAAAARARANGAAAARADAVGARLRERSTSPDDVRKQAARDRRELRAIVDLPAVAERELRGLNLKGFSG